MDYPPQSQLERQVEDLEQIVRAIALKHNDLVVSVSMIWAEIQRTSPDVLSHHMCAKRLDEMSQLLYQVDPGDRPDLSSHPLTANEYEESRPTSYD